MESLIWLVVLINLLAAQPRPSVRQADYIRTREAFRLSAQLGDSIWPGWSSAPTSMILVTADSEFLFNQPTAPADFTRAGGDTLLGQPVFARARRFPPQIQATFPAVNGVNTIVIGEAEHTADRTSTRWVLTVLHEHFHQLTYTRPGYSAAVDSLGLAHGDRTGMWMLNYPFPYDSANVQAAFTTMTRALGAAIAAPPGPRFQQAVREFRHARDAFRRTVPAEAERYFEFQLWQEGVARYTELEVGERAATAYAPSDAFRSLPDYTPFGDVAAAIRARILTDLQSLSLARTRREVVYSVGAAEAMLLDRTRPGWKREYFAHPFRLPDE